VTSNLHPELLDWLASEFLKSGWSAKQVHKLIVMSATYRNVNGVKPKATEIDASNRLLWRQNPRRLEAESLRDAVLKVAGTLNPERGGPGFAISVISRRTRRLSVHQSRETGVVETEYLPVHRSDNASVGF